MEVFREALADHLYEKRKQEKKQSRQLAACVEGCVAAFSPDVDLHVGKDHLPASGEILVAKSPMFKAMLKDESPMKEAVTRQVELPAADVETIRALICLLHRWSLSWGLKPKPREPPECIGASG